MKFLHEVKAKITNSKWFVRLKRVKHIEIIIAVLLAVISLSIYFAISAKEKGENIQRSSIAEMNEKEARVSEMITEISGVGKARVMITEGDGDKPIGVVVVAENADDMTNRIKIIRCVATTTGATVDQIEIFEMGKGG